jgi:hypothetical protein
MERALRTLRVTSEALEREPVDALATDEHRLYLYQLLPSFTCVEPLCLVVSSLIGSQCVLQGPQLALRAIGDLHVCQRGGAVRLEL